MSGATPYWIRVIRHFLAKGYYQNGLTLPFLFAARTIVEPDQPLLSIAAFVQDATEYPAGTTKNGTDISDVFFAGTFIRQRNLLPTCCRNICFT